MRSWTASSGAKLEAKLTKHSAYYVVLEKSDGSKVKISPKKLSKEDQEYIKMLAFRKYEVEPPPAKDYKLPLGVVSPEIKCEKDAQWTYYLYLPPNFHTSRKWPVMFIMSPGGGSQGVAKRYIKGANMNGWILAVSKQAKNSFEEGGTAVMAMVDDVLARHPIDEKRIYASGFSGGARRAFSLAEALKGKPMAGVLACGAGGMRRDLSSKTVVYGVCGSNCFNRWDMACTMKEIKNKDSKLWVFPGGHDWGGSTEMTDGIVWLNGCYLKEIDEKDELLVGERHRYATMVLKHLNSLVETDPERAYRVGAFLEGFGIQHYYKKGFEETMASLKALPNIQEYVKAEAEMYALITKYYATNVMDYRDNNCPPALTAAADALAAKYSDLKLAETLKKMGGKTHIP